MTFGPQGFFGYGVCTSSVPSMPARDDTPTTKIPPAPGPQAFWWSTYSHAQLPNSENIDRNDIRVQLQSRHGSWADPVIRSIVASADIGTILPTWTTPDLPTWGRNGVVLIGDAAHALPTSSGQGVSQALEDAQVLALLLRHYLCQSHCLDDDDNGEQVSGQAEPIPAAGAKKNAIIQAAEAYCKLRKPRVKRIADRAKAMGDMKRKKSFVGEWLTYFFIWLLGEDSFHLFCSFWAKLPPDSSTGADQDAYAYRCLGKWPWDSYNTYVVGHDAALETESFIATEQKR